MSVWNANAKCPVWLGSVPWLLLQHKLKCQDVGWWMRRLVSTIIDASCIVWLTDRLDAASLTGQLHSVSLYLPTVCASCYLVSVLLVKYRTHIFVLHIYWKACTHGKMAKINYASIKSPVWFSMFLYCCGSFIPSRILPSILTVSFFHNTISSALSTISFSWWQFHCD